MTMSSRERSTASTANSLAMPVNHEWSTEDEIQLFCALDGLKPIGINKHFYMALITDRLSKSLNRDIPAEAIWSHLRSLYNLDLLDDKEPLPFPNDEKEFFLPEHDFADLMQKKRTEGEENAFNNNENTPSHSRSSINAVTLLSLSENITKEITKANSSQSTKDLDKKVSAKLAESSSSKRGPKRTRGSVSHESPSTTPPPVHNAKRRRI